MAIKDGLTAKLLSGITIRVSDGKPFDPAEQKRTTWTQDILKGEKTMAIMDGWKKFSEWLYEKWDVKNTQKRYDQIKQWTDEDFKTALGAVWGMLPGSLQEQIKDFVLTIAKRYGEEIAKKIFNFIGATIKKKETEL